MKAKVWKAPVILLLVAVNKVISTANLHQVPALATAPSNTQPGRLRRRNNGDALASVLRLRGAEEPQQQPPPATTFWEQLRERFTSGGSSPSGSVVVLDHRSSQIMSALGGQVTRALKNGLMQSGARVRRRGLLALLAVACVLSVIGATTSGVVSRPWRGWHTSSPLDVVGTNEDVADGNISGTSGLSSNSSERRRRLLKTPRFPLAYMPWWKALQDRRKVRRIGVFFEKRVQKPEALVPVCCRCLQCIHTVVDPTSASTSGTAVPNM